MYYTSKRRSAVSIHFGSAHLEIMSKDVVVGTYHDGIYTTVDPQREPLWLKRTKDVEQWLRERAIDTTRSNSRLLLRILRFSDREKLEIALKINAAKVTDSYWVREEGDIIGYRDIIFHDNKFDRVALLGDLDGFELKKERTPELTNTGSFEKCWQNRNGSWYLVKNGTVKNYFSEIFTDEFARELGFPTAGYRYNGELNAVETKDFTDSGRLCLEEADSLIGDNYTDFELNYQTFLRFSPAVAEEYKRLLLVDALCMNFDRHEHNYGLLRDADTGSVIGMAPNYDNNHAIFSTSGEFSPNPSRNFLSDYQEFFSDHPLETKVMQEEVVQAIDKAYDLASGQLPVPVIDKDALARKIMASAEMLGI